MPQHLSATVTLSTEQTLSLLKSITTHSIDGLTQAVSNKLEPTEKLSAENYALLRFCDTLFPYYLNNSRVDPLLYEHLSPLLPIIGATTLNNPQWLWLSTHDLQDLLSKLHLQAIGWQERSGKAAQYSIDKLFTQLSTFQSDWCNGQQELSSNTLSQYLDKEQQRIRKIEKRLQDVERGSLRAKHCQELSVRLLNDKMNNKKLPQAISHFLHNDWRDSIVLSLINSEDINREYQRLNKLTETFIWTIQPFDEDDTHTQQRIYRLIPTLQEELQTAIISLKHETEKLAHILSTIENQHVTILKGGSLTYGEFSLLSNDNPLNDSHTKISQTLLKQVNLLKEGQWFLHNKESNNNNEQHRIKLSLKLNDSQQLLFCDHNGIKSCQYSFDEFAYKLSTRAFKLLPIDNRLAYLSSQFIDNLLSIRKNKIDLEEKIEKEKINAELVLSNQRLAAQQKAVNEAKALEEAEIKSALEEKIKAETESNNKKQQAQLKMAKQLLDTLKVGASVSFTDKNTAISECKLAAKIQHTEKYVFVNRKGLKDRELSKADLLTQLAEGVAEITHNSSGFEETLSKVVTELRNKQS